ncbi:24904_t:CDS:2 [Entrophospora sp. SA101]|nr:14075_t:CDS:2 [Entrophospora sp. SA101]CAJ0747050.1 24904_t:CDS:2 [Entrophospora sp. SA101]CAJ0836354.1 2073_t:CDS:2 [Entrophospora sp. SA101]
MPLLISFEGIDGSGKTSLVEKLSQKLPDSFITKEPRGTELGKRLEQGKLVLVDRYIDSTFVYQGLRGNLAEEQKKMRVNSIREVFQKFINTPFPHLTFILDLEPAKAQTRLNKREESYYGNTFFSLHLVKGNETYEAVAFVGKEEVISLEERIERKLNSFINIKKLIQKAGKDNNEIMEKLTKLEEQVELIKQDLKENTTNNEWQKSRIQREKERVEERLNKYSQLKAGNYYHFHLKMKEKKGETYYVLLDFQEVNRGN